MGEIIDKKESESYSFDKRIDHFSNYTEKGAQTHKHDSCWILDNLLYRAKGYRGNPRSIGCVEEFDSVSLHISSNIVE